MKIEDMFDLSESRFDKYNPNHDELGRFSSGSSSVQQYGRSKSNEGKLNQAWDHFHATVGSHKANARRSLESMRGLKPGSEEHKRAKASAAGHLFNAISASANYPSNDERTQTVIGHLLDVARMNDQLGSDGVRRNLASAAGHVVGTINSKGLPRGRDMQDLVREVNRYHSRGT